MFLQTGSASHALAEFQAALATKPNQIGALKGAGLAAIDLGLFRMAESYLMKASRQGHPDSDVDAALKTTQDILGIDPFERGLSKEAAMARTQNAFRAAASRLGECIKNYQAGGADPRAAGDLQTAHTRLVLMTPWSTDAEMRSHPERAADLMGLVFDIEKITARNCGTPKGFDMALLELARMPREELR
jgi:hypothetical protein